MTWTSWRPLPDALPVLARGKHIDPSQGACAMEWHTLLTGEPFDDHCACADPALQTLVRAVDDALVTDSDRQEIVPFIARISDTRHPRDTAVQLVGAIAVIAFGQTSGIAARSLLTHLFATGRDSEDLAARVADAVVLATPRPEALLRALDTAFTAAEHALSRRWDPDRAPALPSASDPDRA